MAAKALGAVAAASVTAGTQAPPVPLSTFALTDQPPGSVWRYAPTAAAADLVLPPHADEALARVVASFEPAILVVEHPALIRLLGSRRPVRPRIIVDLHNVESAVSQRAAARIFPLAFGRWRAELSAARASRRAERQIAVVADRVWACSPQEATRFRKVAGAASIRVVPNGIPRPDRLPKDLAPLRQSADGTVHLAMIGHLGYGPNVAAARWFIQRVLPALRRHLDARLVLAGRAPGPDIIAFAAASHVQLVPDPERTEDVLQAADIAILPLRLGGGTRIKAIEAMAWGIPIVATRFAVEGLGLVDGVHFRAAETARDFVGAVTALARDPEERLRLRAAARAHCMANFGPGAIAAAVREGLAAP
ncbi:MAG: glycosyltransferase [Rhodospirillaceae bacterium]|nr:glycosyltransferase [Rhodospirillaceae bacterium]